MKLISFVIPAYNSQDYLNVAVDSLLVAGNDIEIIIINDGSKDRRIDLKELWKHIKKSDISTYRYLKYRSMNILVNFLPWKLKSYVMVKGYLYLAKKIKLG